VTAVRARSCVELFAGLGGMARGLADAGFEHSLVVERDAHAVATLSGNHDSAAWPLYADDVRGLNYEDLGAGVSLLAAGVPCQPFSQGGAHAGPADERNMFPETFRAIRELQPKAVFIENVRGLARPRFAPFVAYIVDHLRAPHVAIRDGEHWRAHHRRLIRSLATDTIPAIERYEVEWHPVCTADYGVAQRRVRVIMVAIRSDLAFWWRWPEPTHSADSLLREKLDGYYWDEQRVPVPPIIDVPTATADRAKRLRRPLRRQRWRTLRDVIGDLPDPGVSDNGSIQGHIVWPGARLYRGHRGCALDEPSKTIKAGVHGVAGGEHIVHMDDGSYRYMTVRECMRVQDLPDSMRIEATRTGAMRQIGNAVPPTVAHVFGLAIARAVCDPAAVPRAEYVERQDVAAGGYLLRQIELNGRRLTASVRIQRGYAYLYFNRSAGPPIYLGPVPDSSKDEQLFQGWRIAHTSHAGLFIAFGGSPAELRAAG
jgi:DNA (cytosine-5)-methyltransferase 1